MLQSDSPSIILPHFNRWTAHGLINLRTLPPFNKPLELTSLQRHVFGSRGVLTKRNCYYFIFLVVYCGTFPCYEHFHTPRAGKSEPGLARGPPLSRSQSRQSPARGPSHLLWYDGPWTVRVIRAKTRVRLACQGMFKLVLFGPAHNEMVRPEVMHSKASLPVINARSRS